MKTLSLIATAALVGSLGLSVAPAFAATSSTAGNVPYCEAASPDQLSQTKQALSEQLQLSTKLGSIDEWNGCLKVMYTQGGHTTVAFYDPSSLKLIDTLGVAS